MTVRTVAAGLAFPEGPVVLTDGRVLTSEMAAGRVTLLATTGPEPYAEVGGGPNGLLSFRGGLLVCQNGGCAWGIAPWPYDLPGATRLFRPTGTAPRPVPPQLQWVAPDGRVSTLATSFTALDGSRRDLVRPSDIAADGAGGFYLTDGAAVRGRTRELTGVLHGTADGELREIVYPLEMPNGVAVSPDGAHVYVAETRTRRIWRFDMTAPGVLTGARGFATVPSGGPLNVGGADGLCVDRTGCVVVATLGAGGICALDPGGRLLLQIPMDDPMTTNVVVDETKDRLLVTLASTGRVVAVEGWSDVLARARR
jgi:gluconolactonase